MSNNLLIDRESFIAGYESALLSKEADLGNWLKKFSVGGVADSIAGGMKDLGNGAIDLASRGTNRFLRNITPEVKNMGSQVGEGMGSGAVQGGVNGVQEQAGKAMDWLGNKTEKFVGDAKDFGSNILKDPSKTMGEHPWMTAGAGAGILGAGYLGGKALGLWGGDNKPNNNFGSNGQGNNNFSSNGQPPPMMQPAYTQGYTPMALNKAGSDFPIPPMLMARLNPAVELGSSIYDVVNSNNTEVPEKREVSITPENDRVNKLLQNPKMRAYVTSLIRDTTPQM